MQGVGAVGPVARPTRRPYVPFTARTSTLVLKLSASRQKTIISCKRSGRDGHGQFWIDAADPDVFKLHSERCETCWGQPFAAAGEGSSESGGSMSDAALRPRSPRHQRKRRRLSALLDRLTVHIRNNNHYITPRWLLLDAPHSLYEQPKTAEDAPQVPFNYEQLEYIEDAPLDLSKKPEPKVHAVKVKDSFSCSACGQTFAVHDRLAKHIASRHRNRTPDAQRQYECETCLRRFARSDMLTRHARLHSGLKPYACPVCAQVFSRSDHLATHQRTHTGEKPYHCPACPYAACRRDMITRHMRTHTKKDAGAA